MSAEEFARSIQDPYNMFSNIDTGLCYIEACKLNLEIRMRMFQMRRISEKEFKDSINDSLFRILNELIAISIYTTSAPYQKEFQLLSDGNKRTEILNKTKGFLDPELRPHLVQSKVAELISQIRELLKEDTFVKVLKIKDHKEILKILKHDV